MDVALCTLNNTTYKANQFQHEDNLDEKRRFLICKECKNTAFFRKAAKNGRVACFYAVPHKDTCTLKSEDLDFNKNGRLSESEQIIINSGDIIKLDFNFEDNKSPANNSTINSNPIKTSSTPIEENSTINKNTVSRRLSSIINIIKYHESFVKSDHFVKYKKYEYKAKNLFKSYEEISEEHKKRFVGLYGRVSSVNKVINKDEATTSIWLNFPRKDVKNISILITNNLFDQFLNKFRNHDQTLEDVFIGKLILCFGDIKLSKQDALYIMPKDIGYIDVER